MIGTEHAPDHLPVEQRRHRRGVIGNFTGQGVSRGHEFIGLVDAANQPTLERFLGAEYTAGIDPFGSLHRSHQTRQEPAGAGLHGDAPTGEDEAELGVGRGQTDIHRQGHGHPDPHRRPVESADHRFGAFVDAQGHGTAAIAQVSALRLVGAGVPVEGIAALLQVGTRTEGPAGTGDDDHSHIVIRIGSIEGRDQFTAHRAVEGVHAVRAVEGQGEDAILYLVIEGFELHGGLRSRLVF